MSIHAAIRTDSSIVIGTGHMFRCLTLAGALLRRGARVSFICRNLRGNISDAAEKAGFPVYRIPKRRASTSSSKDPLRLHWTEVDWESDARETQKVLDKVGTVQWLIVDHYALDRRWEKRIRPRVGKILVIDDLANRPHDCDMLLDQNLSRNMDARYSGLVASKCQRFLGPRYSLIRPEFFNARKTQRIRDGHIKRMLVFFGGSDPSGETAKALEAVREVGRTDIIAEFVVGGKNPHRNKVERMCASMPNAVFHCQTENMADLIARADLAIGSGGGSLWERCLLALPSIVVIVANNQAEQVKALARRGIIRNLGWREKVDFTMLAREIRKAIADPSGIKKMGERAASLMATGMAPDDHPIVRAILDSGNPDVTTR